MKPPPFAYARPESVAHALDLLHGAGDDAKLLAGGQSLVPLLAFRLARPSHLVDVSALEEYRSITTTDAVVTLGGLARHADVEAHPEVRRLLPALSQAARQIGHAPIRAVGTLGGSVAHADPSAELPTTLLALAADVVIRSVRGERRVGIDDLLLGPFMTSLEYDEMIVGVEVAVDASPASAFEEVVHRAGDFALAAAAVTLRRTDAGDVDEARIALGGVGPRPELASSAQHALVGHRLTTSTIRRAAELAAADSTPPSDSQAPSSYRRDLVRVTVQRALTRLMQE
jgi:CO/xanthine dehydrogenase FAD-binding subunit